MGVKRLHVAMVIFVSAGVGCGLRSDPLFIVDTDAPASSSGDEPTATDTATDTFDTDTESDDSGPTNFPPPEEGRLGSCSNPIVLPTTDAEIEGELGGPGLYPSSCQTASGLEDVYVFSPPAATDVTLTFDPGRTDFNPIVQVLEYACDPTMARLRQCTDDWFAGSVGDPRHFVALGNRDYYIYVDSNDGDGGDYAFSMTMAPPPLTECEVHPETIFHNPGGTFRWQNEFSGGQGAADSLCGGVGKENFFPLQIDFPTFVNIVVTGSGGFRPNIGVRTGCSALTEQECTSDQILGTPGFAQLEVFLDPGLHYLSVDGLDQEPGSYTLDVVFD